MISELHIFNKVSKESFALTNWDDSNSKNIESSSIEYNGGKFKNKSSAFKEIANELNFIFRENEGLAKFFNDFELEINIVENHTHLLSYSTQNKSLIIDSKIYAELIPVYLYALFYASTRNSNIDEDECFKKLGEFFYCFAEKDLFRLRSFFENKTEYDASNHFYEYLCSLISVLDKPFDEKSTYIKTQLLRNRTIVGKSPWDITKFEDIRDLYAHDPFSGDAISTYYEAFKEYFNKDFAPKYYQILIQALHKMGLKIVSQRGSRVAHEQGPILVNSKSIFETDDIELNFKKLHSSLNTIHTNFLEIKDLELERDTDFAKQFLNINFYCDELFYLLETKKPAKSRLTKNLKNLKAASKEFFEYVEERIELVEAEDPSESARSKLNLFEKVQENKKIFEESYLNASLSLDYSFKAQKVAIILLQRPSLRSGHFIPRFVLGENLYLETDETSEEQRLKAIPYNFICPNFSYITEIDAFFENASISIITDKNTSEPQIKWQNAEDLAVSIAPSMYQAILSSSARGSKFHYQLETTLFGSLIDLFRAILEDELSNIASIDQASKDPKSSRNANKEVQKLVQAYQDEVLKAAEFSFDYYLLENHVQEHMLKESLTREEAIFELILTMSDVQLDIAKYCILSRSNKLNLEEISKAKLLERGFSHTEAAKYISNELSAVNDFEAKQFIKKYIRFPESTARKEYLSKNKNIERKTITSNKSLDNVFEYYNFTVAPSRIDFGKHAVASVTTLMGRMLGADDNEAIKAGKEYVDLVSQADNHIFETSSEAGTAKVIENTCRAMQYAKTIAFQGIFQNFEADGQNIRSTINSRNSADVGLHVFEQGTMASTGYCITKEPLFILLSLSFRSDDLMKKLGITDLQAKNEIRSLMHSLLKRKHEFLNNTEWQSFAMNEVVNSPAIQKHLTENDTPWLPNLNSLVTLFNHLGEDQNIDQVMQRNYAKFASSLIKYARIVNETGIIQRIHIMNDAIRRAKLLQDDSIEPKNYDDLVIALNASYKGNVSDERENANQYIMALLLKEKQYIKNLSNEDIFELVDHQIENYPLPKEIRVVDPLVDPDIFMGGELKNKAEDAEQKLITISQQFSKPFSSELIHAAAASYGSDVLKWRLVRKELAKLESSEQEKIKEELEKLVVDFKYLETYHKGFSKDPLVGYQGTDVIQLNANHDNLIDFVEDMVTVRTTMKIKNPDSLLVLVDNPQQGKRSLLDYDKTLEWLALGGTLASHMVSAERYESWREQINKEKTWARDFIRSFLGDFSEEENQNFINDFKVIQDNIDIKRDLISTKYQQASEMKQSLKSLKKYRKWNKTLAKINTYSSLEQISFSDWLILGGRWLLNGSSQRDIDYIVNVFNRSEKLKDLIKQDFEMLELFVSQAKALTINSKKRIIQNSGSTKEADLIVTSASDGLEYRAAEARTAKAIAIRFDELQKYERSFPLIPSKDDQYLDELLKLWDKKIGELDKLVFDCKAEEFSSDEFTEKRQRTFAKLLKILEKTSEFFINKYFNKPDKHDIYAVHQFVTQREGFVPYMEAIFGDHRKHGGLFQKLAAQAVNSEDSSPSGESESINFELFKLSKLGEMFNISFMLFLTLEINDPNEMINKLSSFFDQYLNVHEEDYPPYMFHRLCAGDSFGFHEGYVFNENLRQKMFTISCKTGYWIYKYMHHAVSKRSPLKESSQEYKDCMIGDFDRGVIPICYQHETISLEERLWDCVRAIRNFVRNNHDKHPLPVIIKGEGATVDNLFRSEHSVAKNHDLVWITGLANPGKHSWDVNCVFRSPILREMPIQDETGTYVNVSVFTPYLSSEGKIKQIYTAFLPEIIESGKFEYIAPLQEAPYYQTNSEGFVHARVVLNEADSELPSPDVTMSAHTHPQYISQKTLNWGYPEAWSYLSMKQMYSKTEVPKILDTAGLDALAQIEFYQNELNSKEEIKEIILERIEELDLKHIEKWILKASKDSGGRGVSNDLSISHDLDEIVDFIYFKSKTDDVVMQEFLPNNAKAFTSSEFIQKVKDAFIEEGLALPESVPDEAMYFSTRAFQSINGIKGYLFSVNIGSVTVNAGQGAKMFYGEPSYIMPLFLAGKIQKLMDEHGEMILKEAIPKHAEAFAKENNLEIKENICGFSNTLMLNGLFDYIPYIYAIRADADAIKRNYKISCEDNSYGGLDYYYYYQGEKVMIASGEDHRTSLIALENAIRDTLSGDSSRPEELIDIGLAKIEFNSGLGQANLLQRVIEESNPGDKDMFLEWTMDLGMVGRMYQVKSGKVHNHRH